METNQYIDMFLDESLEHIQAVNDNLLKLEKQPQDLSIINEIFRSAHTLKGMAATMGFTDIASLTHQMENVLDKIRNSELAVTAEVIDVTFEAVEHLDDMVSAISNGEDGKKDVSELVLRLEQIEKGTTALETTKNQPNQAVGDHLLKIELDQYQATIVAQAEEQGFKTFQITIGLTEDCMLKAARAYMVFEALEELGEIIKSVPTVAEIEEENFEQDFSIVLLSNESAEVIQARIHKVSEIEKVELSIFSATDKEEPTQTDKLEKDSDQSEKTHNKANASKTIRVNIERIDDLMNLFEEVVIDRGRLEDLSKKIEDQELKETVEHMSRVSADMQSLILTMRMVPIEQVFNRFPRMVRGLAKDLEKNISLEITGAETEVDRTVIDEIGDPLVHLIRNSVDHGIESPAKRKQSGKVEEGKLSLRAFHSGNHVFVEIEDDGAGINRDKVVAKAEANGLISSDHSETLTDEEVYQLILSPGFSTADEISDISGRGVGLDVVRSKIESLGGTISIESEAEKGSKFTIQLPLTLSILSTLLVKVQNETYSIPLSSVMETVILENELIMKVHGQKVMDFRGEVIPLVSLKEVFNVPSDQVTNEQNDAVVVVRKGDRLTGLIVDSLIGQKEVVLKSMGNYLGDIHAISGATILGDGQVSLIIDPSALIK